MGVGSDALDRVRHEVEAELKLICEELLSAAAKDAPVESQEEHQERHPGQPHLKDSGFIRLEVTPHEIRGTVGFSVFYAKWQHEYVEWTHPHGGRSKFLEAHLLENFPHYRRRLAAASRRALNG
jgi:hypothetical protein